MQPLGSSLTDQVTYVSCLLYGKEGTGKTTDALQLSRLGRVLVVNLEAGVKKQALIQRGVVVENVELWPPPGVQFNYQSFNQLPDLIAARLAEQPGAYIGVVLDSGTEIQAELVREAVRAGIARDLSKGKARDDFQVNLEDYGTASQMIKLVIRKFRSLPVHLFITALERRDVDQESGHVQYGPAMGPSAARDVMGQVDIVGYKTVEMIGKDPEPFYIGNFAPIGVRRAKDRYSLLPARMINPGADKIVAFIEGQMTKDTDPDRPRVMAAMASAQEAAAAAPTATQTPAASPQSAPEPDSAIEPEQETESEGGDA